MPSRQDYSPSGSGVARPHENRTRTARQQRRVRIIVTHDSQPPSTERDVYSDDVNYVNHLLSGPAETLWEGESVKIRESALEALVEYVDQRIFDLGDGDLRSKHIEFLLELAEQYGVYPHAFVHQDVKHRYGKFTGTLKGKCVYMKTAPFRKPRSSVEAKKRRIVSARPLHWAQFKHPNLVGLIGVTWMDYSPLLIFPGVGCGSVKAFVCAYDDCNKLDIVTQAAQGLQYLHTIQPLFVHGDVRAENLLIGSDGTVCWTGFLFLPTPNDESVRWQPPEVLRNFDGQFHRSRDIYAFGSLLIELVTEECPFVYVSSDEQVIQDVCAHKRPKRPYPLDRLSSDLWDLADRCHSHNPGDRISCNSIVRALERTARQHFPSDTELAFGPQARDRTFVESHSWPSRNSGHASRHGAPRALGSLSPDIDLRGLTFECRQPEPLPQDLGRNDRIAATPQPAFSGAPVIPLQHSVPPVYPSPYLVERSFSPEVELPANQWLLADVLSREIYGLFYSHLEPPGAFVMVVELILQSGCIRSHIILDIAVWYVRLYQRAYYSSMGTFDDMAVVTAVCILLAVQFWDDDPVFGSTYRFNLPALARLTGLDRSVLQTVHDKIALHGFINLNIYSLEQIQTRRVPQAHTSHNHLGWM